ncbi:hypothetical protein HOD05_00455 [Candidatus Woesearchaeota archaeon]|jgi:hypothetical protein|nr:hypothetical protein [Candidatus Woesearchaeota archaeon]MBT4150879.1 hypothetical protein [Candidatus Woesearchaeota archaeon]MBT4246892.1 hypothetical protein [Candidatus Woesearchaeota archaeon]MBT4433669.1 hypothetical protein [Candidatus Woesearchaeota archaeon]
MVLSLEHRIQIVHDMSYVASRLDAISGGREPNRTVHDTDYISPSICLPDVPLDHEGGEFMYHAKMMGYLHDALTETPLPREIENLRAPKYLTDLMG